jgi:fibronectin-binding autotransporter adhesin
MRRKHRARIIGLLGAACGCLTGGHVGAAVTDITWTGSGTGVNVNLFNSSTNWSPNTAPGPTTDVQFTPNPSTITNNAPNLGTSVAVNGVVFGYAGWTISGTTLKIGGGSDANTGDTGGDGIVVNTTASPGTDTISAPLQLGDATGSTDNGTYSVNVANGNTLVLNTVTAYSGNSCKLSFNGNSTGVLSLQGSSANTFASDLIGLGGTIQLDKAASTNATGGKLIVNNSCTAIYEANSQIPNTFRLGDSAVVSLNGFNQTLTSIVFNNNATNTAENGAGTVDLNGGVLTISTGGTISTTATVSGVTETTALIDGNGNPSSALALGGSATFTTNAGNTTIGLNINAPITGGSGNTLTIASAGTNPGAIEFSGANTFTATTSITTGTLILNNTSALGGGGVLDLHGGKLQNGTSSALGVSNPVTLTASSTVNGTQSLSFTGTFTNSGGNSALNNNLTSGTLTLGGATAGSGNIYLSESATTGRTLTLTGTSTGSTIVNAVIADYNGSGVAGNLTIGNTGNMPTVTLNASNTYTGTTAVTNGTLILGSSTALAGGGTLKLNGGNLQNGTGSPLGITNPVTITANSGITGSTSLSFTNTFTNSGGNETLSNNLTSGNLTLGGASAGSGNVYLSEAAGTGRTLTLAGTGSTIINGVIADYNGAGLPGGLTIGNATAPTITLNAADTYTGTTTLTNGTLVLNNSAALAGGGTLKLNGGNLQNSTGSPLSLSNATNLTANSTVSGTGSIGLAGVFTNSGGNEILSNNLTTGTLTIGGASAGSGNVYLSESAIAGRTLTLTGTGTTTVNAVIADYNGVGLPGNLTIGSATIPAAVTLAANNTYGGNTLVNAGTLTIAAGGSLPATTNLTVGDGTDAATVSLPAYNSGLIHSVTLASMTLKPNAVVSVGSPSMSNHADRSELFTNALTLTGSSGNWSGKLDLGGNDLVIHNADAPTAAATLANVTDQLKSGYGAYGGSYWAGNSGIVSSAAAGDSTYLTTLGSATGLTSFDGAAVSTTDVLVKYTYYGDANLDGTVDGTDYSMIDTGFGGGGTGWQYGDFNYDGKIDGSDYSLIDNAFNMQGSNGLADPMNMLATNTAEIAGTASAVPEPGSLTIFGIGAVGLSWRRRRRES